MKITREGYDKLLRAFRISYEQRDGVMDSDSLRHNVMRRIREQREPDGTGDLLTTMGMLLWRLAPVTLILIVIAAGFVATRGFVPGYDTAYLLKEDPFEYIYTEGTQSL